METPQPTRTVNVVDTTATGTNPVTVELGLHILLAQQQLSPVVQLEC